MKQFRSSVLKSFTLIEMLVAMAVLVLIMAIIFQITSEAGSLWKSTTAKVQSFQAARAGFESISRRISQATLNTHYDYFDANENAAESSSYSGTPATYGRQSELHFISGPGLLTGSTNQDQVTHAIFFQAPLGYSDTNSYSQLGDTLNAIGYYVTYGSDTEVGTVPSFVSSRAAYQARYRYRLMQFTQSCEYLSVYSNPTAWSWFVPFILTNAATSTTPTHLVANNIIALVILPKQTTEDDPTGTNLCPYYTYDSGTNWPTGSTQPLQMNQLPPIVHLAMIALDEPSAQRICTTSSAPDTTLKITSGNLFQQSANLNADLSTLESTLNQNHLTYRLFETDVAMKGAKWSN